MIEIHSGPLEICAPVDEPLHHGDDEPEEEDDDAVVHVGARDGQVRREDEEHRRHEHVHHADQVEDPAERAREDEGARGQFAAALQDVDGYGHCVAAGVLVSLGGGWWGESATYETPRATTDADVIALKALLEPRNTHPALSEMGVSASLFWVFIYPPRLTSESSV